LNHEQQQQQQQQRQEEEPNRKFFNRKKSAVKESSDQEGLQSDNTDSLFSNDLETYIKSLLTRRSDDEYNQRCRTLRKYEEKYKQLLPPELASSSLDDQCLYVKNRCNQLKKLCIRELFRTSRDRHFQVFKQILQTAFKNAFLTKKN
jgi:hypothetical protein